MCLVHRVSKQSFLTDTYILRFKVDLPMLKSLNPKYWIARHLISKTSITLPAEAKPHVILEVQEERREKERREKERREEERREKERREEERREEERREEERRPSFLRSPWLAQKVQSLFLGVLQEKGISEEDLKEDAFDEWPVLKCRKLYEANQNFLPKLDEW